MHPHAESAANIIRDFCKAVRSRIDKAVMICTMANGFVIVTLSGTSPIDGTSPPMQMIDKVALGGDEMTRMA